MKYLFIVICLAGMYGCTDASIADFQSLGNEHTITLYSGGKAVRTWISTGKVVTETNSDGYIFMDKETENVVKVTGDLVIEVRSEDD